VHETTRFPARILLEAWDEGGIEMMRRRVEAVQRHGARIFGQLVHLGRESPGGTTDSVPIGPSPIPQPRDPAPPHEMSRGEIRTIIEAFGRSAANMKAAHYGRRGDPCGARLSRRAVPLPPASNRRTDAHRGDTLEAGCACSSR